MSRNHVQSQAGKQKTDEMDKDDVELIDDEEVPRSVRTTKTKSGKNKPFVTFQGKEEIKSLILQLIIHINYYEIKNC